MSGKPGRCHDFVPTVKKLIQGKVFRKDLYPYFQELGGDPASWAKILRFQVEHEQVSQMHEWNAEDWKKYLADRWTELRAEAPRSQTPIGLSEELVAAAKEFLPSQPWPPGIHRELADKMGVTTTQASRYIQELIRRGDFLDQIDGQLILPDEQANP